MSDFDGSSVIYLVLASRNYQKDGGIGAGASAIFYETFPYYLCSAKSLYDLMGWE